MSPPPVGALGAGFPENLQYTEFRRRYSLLALADCTPERGDERAAVEALLHHLDMEPSSYRLGLSQVSFGPQGHYLRSLMEQSSVTHLNLQTLLRERALKLSRYLASIT